MILRRLERDALFITADPRDGWCLPKGTTVALLHNVPSPLTGRENERHVSAPDAIGRLWRGWIAVSTPTTEAPTSASIVRTWKRGTIPILWEVNRIMKLTALDQLRELVLRTAPREGFDKRGQPVNPYDVFTWLCRFSREQRPLLERVLRQFKKPVPKDDVQLVSRLCKLTLNEEVSMSKIQKTRKQLIKTEQHKAAVAAAEKPTKKGKRTAAPKARSMARTVGEALLSIQVLSAVHTIARRLVQEKVSHKELLQLKKAINKTAAQLREKGKSSLASQLSSQNRLVRRLERSAR